MTTTVTQDQGDLVQLASTQARLEAFANYLSQIPDAPDSDGSEIIADIMSATSWEGVNTEGKMPDTETMRGRRLKITSFGKRPTDMNDSKYPWYLVVDSIDADTGEMVKWQTSSETVMAQLVKLALLGTIPAVVTVERAEKATKRGYYPLSLRVHAAEPAKRTK